MQTSATVVVGGKQNVENQVSVSGPYQIAGQILVERISFNDLVSIYRAKNVLSRVAYDARDE